MLDIDLSQEPQDIKDCLQYSIFDIDKGLLIQLGEDKEIVAALRGSNKLGREEIEKIYGSPSPKFEVKSWPIRSSF